jgi:hypothetical protein
MAWRYSARAAEIDTVDWPPAMRKPIRGRQRLDPLRRRADDRSSSPTQSSEAEDKEVEGWAMATRMERFRDTYLRCIARGAARKKHARGVPARTVLIALVLTLAAAPVRAQTSRSYVSRNGDDVNNCTQAAPCRTFSAAFAVTAPGGQIEALDPADYGNLTITHSISIVGTGTVLVPPWGLALPSTPVRAITSVCAA